MTKRKKPIWPKTVMYGGRNSGKMANFLVQAENAARAMEAYKAALIADGYTVDGDSAYKVTAQGGDFISGRMVGLHPNPLYAAIEQGERVKAAFEIPPNVTARWASGDVNWGPEPGRQFSVGVDPSSDDGDENGFALVEIDYSGIERRIVACYTGDEALMRLWHLGSDQEAPNSVTGGQDF